MPSLLKTLLLGVCLVPFVSAFTYSVTVGIDEDTGQKGIGFDPIEVNPVVGDIVNFQFQSGNHSVVQSTFDHPCTPNGGFNSGPYSVSASTALNATGLPLVEMYINDTIPQFFFDQASGQCQQGAVFAVNPTQDRNVTALKANAANDTPPPTSSASLTGSATGSATASGSTKTNAAVVKYDMVASGAVALLLASLSVLLH
jgi:hypothetical protein